MLVRTPIKLSTYTTISPAYNSILLHCGHIIVHCQPAPYLTSEKNEQTWPSNLLLVLYWSFWMNLIYRELWSVSRCIYIA